MTVRSLLASLAIVAAMLTPRTSLAQFTEPCDRGGRPGTRVVVGAVFVGGNAALYEYFRRAWWSGERTDFKFINDFGSDFREQDKLGHALGGYHLARIGSGLLRAACVGDRKAIWWGAAYAAAFQLQIEVWDGFQQAYGFSVPDLAFNTVGAALAVAQHEQPALQAFKPTFSYRRTEAMRRQAAFPVGTAANELRPSIDYAGQTYWISTDVDRLLPAELKPLWPGILRLSIGHSVTDWIDLSTGNSVRGEHTLVLTLDVDAGKLPGNHPIWRSVKDQLSYLHLPAPALVITPTLRGVAWYR